MNQEELRLRMAREKQAPWKRWGPYLSERQWGTIREDYSQAGDVWDHFTHDQARSRAYRWGEDGIAGISDDQQLLCFALAFWNGADPILKERLFGLTNREGNHGEDCKEYYFYLDATPTYSYLKYLYKYPQPSFPYKDLVQTNRHRGRCEAEYELLDTGIFDEDRYFDIFVEYAKQEAEDLLIRISVWNRGPEPATLHLLPTLWFRNTWSWYPKTAKPVIGRTAPVDGRAGIEASHSALGDWSLFCDRAVPLLFTENETNLERGGWSQNASPYVKDGINNYVVHGQSRVVNPFNVGTKAAAHYKLELAPGAVEVVRLRLVNRELLGEILDRGQGAKDVLFGTRFEECLQIRRQEADEFYRDLAPPNLDDDSRNVMRQAMAGMLWSMQFYLYPVGDWVTDMALHYAKQGPRGTIRNEDWTQIEYADLISVPDKWEYPGLAAWNLAIQAGILARLDIDLAKQQLRLITQQSYAHPSGQLPGSEGNFSDVNPPVYATAAWQIYLLEKALRGTGDLQFLEGVFHRLLLNFTWWANRKDRMGRNVFEGGFIGLDNVGIFDRSVPLPTGGYLEQADGASWMAVYSLDMLTIALELALHNPVYQELAGKFYEHFIYIAAAMSRVGDVGDEMWDEEDGFFYDVLRLPNGESFRLKVRSMVGLIPLFASALFAPEIYRCLPLFIEHVRRFNRKHPGLLAEIDGPEQPGVENRRLLAVVNREKLQRILARMLDESEFLSDYGVRSLSRYYRENPYLFRFGHDIYRVGYEPAESMTGLFGGNSNWRGPVWMPVNALLIQGLFKFYAYYGDDFKVECPTGSGKMMSLLEVARELQRRLVKLFLRDEDGRRPIHGASAKFQQDPHWRELLLFYECFNGDTGAGLGASHQTGWTGLVGWYTHVMDLSMPQTIPQLQNYPQLLLRYAGKRSSNPAT